MHKDVSAVMQFAPDGMDAGHDVVLYQSFEVRAIMDDLLATIPEDAD